MLPPILISPRDEAPIWTDPEEPSGEFERLARCLQAGSPLPECRSPPCPVRRLLAPLSLRHHRHRCWSIL